MPARCKSTPSFALVVCCLTGCLVGGYAASCLRTGGAAAELRNQSATFTQALSSATKVAPRRLRPSASVTNVRFTDTESGDGIYGTVTWDPPASWPATEANRVYRVYLVNEPFSDTASPYREVGSYLWWIDSEENYYPQIPFGTNRMTIWGPNEVIKRQVVLSGHTTPYANFIAVVPKSDSGFALASSLLPSAATAIYDLCDSCGPPPMVIDTAQPDGGIQFVDTNDDPGGLSGKITWTIKSGIDMGYVEFFKVYLASDAAGTNPLTISTSVPNGVNEVSISVSDRGDRDFIRIIPSNNVAGDCITAASKALHDLSHSSPTVQVGSLAFTDSDNREYHLQGTITWTSADDLAPIFSYLVYFAMDSSGTGKTLQAEVPTGTNSYTLPSDFDSQSMDYLFVHTKNGLPGSSGISKNPAMIPIVDLTSIPPSDTVASISFTDEDPMYRVVDGTISWTPGDEATVTFYSVYFAMRETSHVDDVSGTLSHLVGTVNLGTNQLVVPTNTSIAAGSTSFHYIHVYTGNVNGKSRNVVSIALIDNRPICDLYTCPSGTSPKADAPEGCVSSSCTTSECCITAGNCSDYTCADGWAKKPSAPSVCDAINCTAQECCERGAEAPANVSGSRPGYDTIAVEWQVAELHDCTFQEYSLQWRLASNSSSNWTANAGCTPLRDICTTHCSATALPSQTPIEFRVKVICAADANASRDLGSAWSPPSAGVATLPRPAEAPSNLNIYGISHNQAWVSWQAGATNDCISAGWTVAVRNPLTSEALHPAPSCTSPTSCVMTGLECVTDYTVQITQACADSQANSPPSTKASFTTRRGLTCVLGALSPSGISLLEPSMTSIRVNWTAGDTRECTFQHWNIEVRPENRAHWSAAQGCENLTAREVTACIAAGLQSNILHEFRVQEVCNNTFASSGWGQSSASVQTLVRPADAPANITTASPTTSSLQLHWEVPQIHDCTFSEYIVQWCPADDLSAAWTVPQGCSGLTSACESLCTAGGLPSNTTVVLRVRVACVSAGADSDFSMLSAAMATRPVPAAPPTGVAVGNGSITSTEATVSWQAAALNDCTFESWAVVVRDLATNQVVGPQLACDALDFGGDMCKVGNLTCNTHHSLTVAVRCMDSHASSVTSAAVQFTTTMGGSSQCLLAAVSPSDVVAADPTITTLNLSWTAGDPRDCSFERWAVEVRPENSASWSTTPGCASLSSRGTVQCIATELQSNMRHDFRVQEICSNAATDSQWAETAIPTATLVRPAEAPANVTAASPTTNSLQVHWDVPRMRDCTFREYVVQWRPADDPQMAWAVPAGCSGLASACESLCTASGLPSSAGAVFRVRVACASTGADSSFSALSAAVATLPVPAAPPTVGAVTGIKATGANVSWKAGAMNDCAFAGWAVEVQDLATNQAVVPQAACSALGSGDQGCQVDGLTCNTQHAVTVTVNCVDSHARSAASTPVPFTTILGGSSGCLLSAVSPSGLVAADPTITTLNLSWTAGDPRDCSFERWAVEVRPENSASWSTTPGCASLSSRGTVQCIATELQSNMRHDFRVQEICSNAATDSQWAETAIPTATLVRPAEAPANVTAASPTTNSLQVRWDVPRIRDCTFREYVVQWRPADDLQMAWAVPAGCSGLASACESLCTASGLPSSAGAVFRVRVACASTGADSSFSALSATVATLPVPAAPPTGGAVTGITATGANVSWQAGALNDCTFAGWAVVVQDLATKQAVGPQAACSALSSGGQACHVDGLTCNTQHAVTVAVNCTDSLASSAASTPVHFTTILGGSSGCLLSAVSPSAVVATNPTTTTLNLSWASGDARDCSFMRWAVEVRPENRASWSAAQGCMSLTSRTAVHCIATGLQSNTHHQFRVQEICANTATNSQWGESVTSSATLVRPAETPMGVVVSNPGRNSLVVGWEVVATNDCIFRSYVVQQRLAGDPNAPWAAAVGCAEVTSACVSVCTAEGLPSNTAIVFRIAADCVTAETASGFSNTSAPLATLPTPAGPPESLTASEVSDRGLRATWQAGALNDCTFGSWEVVVRSTLTGAAAITQATCTQRIDGSIDCLITGLSCDTHYSMQASVTCTDTLANSELSVAATFRTLRGSDCSRAAQAPVGIYGVDPSFTTLRAVWTPGEPRDCSFAEWLVEFRMVGTNGAAGAELQPPGCRNLTSRSISSCLATSLHENTPYFVRVQELCREAALNSPMAESSVPTSTKLVPTPEVIMQDPMPGSSVSQRVDQVLLMFSELVQLNGSTVLTILSDESPGPCAMPPTSTSGGFRLRNGRIALWPVNSTLWHQDCKYRFEVDGGTFVTVLQPAKAVAPLAWTFTYNATVPTLQQVVIQSSSSDKLAVAVAWDQSVVFRCGVAKGPITSGVGELSDSFSGVSGELAAVKGELATMTFTGLVPAQVYAVYCSSEVQEDRLVRTGWLFAGNWATPADENRYLRSLRVSVAHECLDGSTGAYTDVPLSPAFNRDKTAYQAVVASIDTRATCGGAQSTTDASWRVTVTPELDSTYASSTLAWFGGENISAQLRRIRLPQGTAFVDMNTTVSVSAMAEGVPPLLYTVSILVMQVHFQVAAPRIRDAAGTQISAGTAVDESWKMEVDVSTSGVQIPMELWTRLVVYVGPFSQFTAVRTISSQDQLHVLEVNQLLGIGRNLPVQIQLEGTVVGEAPGTITFVDPAVTCVSLSEAFDNCDRKAQITVDTINETTLYARGRGFGNHPMLTQDVPLADKVMHLEVTSTAAGSSGSSLCRTSRWVSSTQLECVLRPNAPPPLELVIYGPNGTQVVQLLKVPWGIEYKTPSVQEIYPPVLPIISSMAGTSELYIIGNGFPDFAVGGLGIQLRSASSARRLLQAASQAMNPCREVARINGTHLRCRLMDFLDVSQLGCKEPEVIVTFGGLESRLQVGKLEVMPPNITSVAAPLGPYGSAVEVGSGLRYELRGAGFGTTANGRLVVQVGQVPCAIESRNDSVVTCSADGPLRADLLGSYPQATAKPGAAPPAGQPLRVVVSVPIMVTLGSPGPGCDPISAEWPYHSVQLLPCPRGHRRANASEPGCLPCAEGHYQPFSGPFLTCIPCEFGFYQEELGQVTCKPCLEHKTTGTVGSTSPEKCFCEVGHYLPQGTSSLTSGCKACPGGAYCGGNTALPVALPDFWLHPDFSVTPCTLEGCLGNNTCAVGYMEAARCENCDSSWYADIVANACKRCSSWIPAVTGIFIAVVVLFIILIILPLIAWKSRRELNPHLKQVPWICFGCIKGLLMAIIFGLDHQSKEQDVFVRNDPPWPRTRRIMQRLRFMEWSLVMKLVEGAEFQRVVNIAVNNIQILGLVGGIGIQYWPSWVQATMLHMSYFLADIETLKPDCFISLTATQRWFLIWLIPYFLYSLFMLAIWLQGREHARDRRKIMVMMSGAALLYLFPPHLMTIMQAFDCKQLSDAHGSWVLENDRSVYCYRYWGISDNPDYLWSFMATVSAVDLLFLCTMMFFVGKAVWRSYWWYREQELGSPPLTSVFLTWWWVVGCRGFSVKHRYAVRGLKTQLARSPMGLSPSEVGGLCEDLFTRNLAELRANVASMAADLRSSKLWQFLDETAGQSVPKKEVFSPKPKNFLRGNSLMRSRSLISISEELSQGLASATENGGPVAPWQRRQILRKNAYSTLAAQIEGIAASWTTMSSYGAHEPASLLSYMWELVNVVNKLGLAFIGLYTTHDPGIGMRAALFWSLFFTVLVIAVRPYGHNGLNFLDCTFSALISFIVGSVVVLEWCGQDAEPSGVCLFFQAFNFTLVVCVIVLAVFMCLAYIYYYVRNLAFRNAFYVLDPDSVQSTELYREATGCSEATSPISSHVEPYEQQPRVVSRVVQRKSEVAHSDKDLKAQWMFCSYEHPGTTPVVLKQGLGLTIRDEALLRLILDAQGGPISMEDDPLPGELHGLEHCGEFQLTRGGNLTGRMVLRLNGKLEENMAELWRLQDQSREFILTDDTRIAGHNVPAGAKLKMVRFAPPGTPEHLARNERPEEFLAKLVAGGDSGLHNVHGLLILEFLRPDTREDIHRELCEMIVSRDEVPQEGCPTVVEDQDTDVDPTVLAREVSPDLVLPLELCLAPKDPHATLHVFKEPAFGCFDKVFILGRYGQQWLIRAAELDLRLGLSSEQCENYNDTTDGRPKSQVSRDHDTGHMGFVRRSMWRTRDGGVVVVHNGQCWGGHIDQEKPEDAYHVEVGELYGMPLTWRSSSKDLQGTAVPGWFDGESIHWFENVNAAANTELNLEEDTARQLPSSPWVRIRNASEEGGIPGPDNGLWSLVTHFYTQCHGPLPHVHIERVAAYQAGDGARDIFVKSMQDTAFEKTKQEMLVPYLSPADLSTVVGNIGMSFYDDPLVRENSYSTLAMLNPRCLSRSGSLLSKSGTLNMPRGNSLLSPQRSFNLERSQSNLSRLQLHANSPVSSPKGESSLDRTALERVESESPAIVGLPEDSWVELRVKAVAKDGREQAHFPVITEAESPEPAQATSPVDERRLVFSLGE